MTQGKCTGKRLHSQQAQTGTLVVKKGPRVCISLLSQLQIKHTTEFFFVFWLSKEGKVAECLAEQHRTRNDIFLQN